MKTNLLLPVLLLSLVLAAPAMARADQKPESIAEKMTVKLARGVTNAATCAVELPKQTILSIRDMGAAGVVVGPLKGIAMTVYRAFIGATEVAFFLVPQPGYYDPMIDPAYVFEGWEPRRDATLMSPQIDEPPAAPAPSPKEAP
jgi:putative exosortase-associated protein (TIGR04073 family)